MLRHFVRKNATQELEMLSEMVRNFTRIEIEPQALVHDRSESFNHELFQKVGDQGLLGMTVDPAYGGTGLCATAATIVHKEMAYSDPGFTLSYLAHSMLFTNNLQRNGTEEQKMRFLPDACTGTRIGGMGMSEPNGGTDVLAMKTHLTDDLVLNGSKIWITNVEIGNMFLVYAQDPGHGGLTLVLVEEGMPGFSFGQQIKDKCGMRASPTGELIFENVKIPVENIVGERGGAIKCMMRNLEIERVTLAGMSLGIAERCLDTMINYSKERTAFGKNLHQFGQIQQMIGTSYGEYMAGESYVFNTAEQLDMDGFGQRLDSDGVKLYCGIMAKNVADRAIQSLGGYGYVGEYNVERLWRDSKLIEIGGGTNEAHQKNIVNELTKIHLV